MSRITTELIDLEFLPTSTNVKRGVRNLEFVLQQAALMAVTSYETNGIVVNLWKNPLEAWRRLHKLYDPMTSGTKRNWLTTIITPGKLSSGTPAGSNDGNPTCRVMKK